MLISGIRQRKEQRNLPIGRREGGISTINQLFIWEKMKKFVKWPQEKQNSPIDCRKRNLKIHLLRVQKLRKFINRKKRQKLAQLLQEQNMDFSNKS